jgi:hypothetical protein
MSSIRFGISANGTPARFAATPSQQLIQLAKLTLSCMSSVSRASQLDGSSISSVLYVIPHPLTEYGA